MSKSRNNLTNLAKSLSRGKAGRTSGLASLLGASSSAPDIHSGTRKLSVGTENGVKSESSNAKSLTGLEFGKPSSNKTTTSSSQSELTSLLKKTESSGVSSLLGGGLLGGLTGLGSIGSLLGGLFGGSHTKTLPPLTTFSLPQSIAASYSVGTSVKTTTSTGAQQGAGIYATPANSPVTSASPSSVSSTRITQAVKTALLSSSSLNDVINEL